jgi:RecB family endonuclease NucS
MSVVPGFGLCASTWFLRALLEGRRMTLPGLQRARVILTNALRSSSPTTFGTWQGGKYSTKTAVTARSRMEKHLEDFLVENWGQTVIGRDYVIFEEDGERVGQQYPTDTGPIDILAISSDRTRLLVVELKRGRASDSVVGQVLRYVGYVQDELAENDQTVEGAIIALEDDLRLRRALAVVPSLAFYRY